MAHLLNLEGVSVVAGARTILDAVSLGLDDGARVGVVGRNGDGKSTLLRLIARTQEPDAGRVTHTRGLRVGVLTQADELDPSWTVRSAVLGGLEGHSGVEDGDAVADHAWAGSARVRAVVDGLLGDLVGAAGGGGAAGGPTASGGSGPSATSAPGGLAARVGDLSGGQRRRTALARLLVGDHDLLLLDEPTNHLDVEGVAWLAEHLRTRWPAGRGALAVVTHDRWFLDAVVERTWEVHDGVVDAFDGGYAAYVLARAERARVRDVTAERQANLLRKELAWLRRGAPARTSKPKFRIEAASALIEREPAPRDGVALARTASARLGKDVLDVEGVTAAVGEGAARRVLLDDVTWRLGPGDRIGIVGVNGSGKTTLLRLLTGERTPDAGRVKRGKTVVAAVLSQDLRELDEVTDLRVLEAVEREARSVLVEGKEVSASSLVERLGFTAARAWTRVADLSGGERRRLQLARLLLREPNVLLLDEPTNDLDTDTLTAVEDVLDGFAGTLVVVSHDRYLLERTTDVQVALLGDGHLRGLVGGVEEYLALRSAAPTTSVATGAARTAAAAGSGTGRGTGSGAGADAAGSAPSSSPGEVRAARKDMARLERAMSRVAAREEELHAALAASSTDYTAVAALDEQLRAVSAEREELEEQWLAAAELVG